MKSRLHIPLIIAIAFVMANLLFVSSLSAQVNGDYQTRVSAGSWGTPSNWSKRVNGVWVTSMDYPGQNTGAGTVTIRNDAEITLNVSPAYAIGNLKVGTSTNGAVTFLLFGTGSYTLAVSGDVNIYPRGDKYISVSNGNLAIGGNLFIGTGASSDKSNRRARMDISTGTVTVAGNLSLITGSGNSDAQQAQLNITGAGTFNLGGNFILNNNVGRLTMASASTFIYNGVVPQTVLMGTLVTNRYQIIYSNLTLRNSSPGGATLGNAITATNVTGNISVASGLFNTNNLAVSRGASKSITVAGGATLNAGTTAVTWAGTGGLATITGTFKTANTAGFSGTAGSALSSTNSPGISLGTNSVIEYNSSANQTVTTRLYNNLTLSGSGTKSFGGNTAINGVISINGTAKASLPNGSVSSALGLNFAGIVQPLGSYGSTLSSATYKNNTYFLSTVSGIVNVSGGCTAGSWLGTTSTDWNTASNWCGGIPTAAMDVIIMAAAPFQPLIGSAGGLCRNITIDNGTALTLGAGNNLTVSGSWTNNGSFTANSGAVILNGANQVVGGANPTIFYNLTANNTATSLENNITVTNTLTLSGGIFTTGISFMFVSNPATAAIVGGSGSAYVDGNLKRSIAAGANTYIFPLGTAKGFTPVSLAFKAGTTAGALTGYTDEGDHPNIGTSPVDPLKSVNRTWTFISESGLSNVNFDATFTFLSVDLDSGSDWNTFLAAKYSGAAWSSLSVGTRTSTTIQATGLTGFGEFQVGEPSSAPTACAYENNGSTPAVSGVTPCIDFESNPQTVSTTFAAHQYFTMNVISGLNYEVYTCNSKSPNFPLKISVYREGAPADPYLAFSYSNADNTCSTADNDVYVSFTPDFSGQVRILINRSSDCGAVTPSGLTVGVNVTGGANLQDDETAAGTGNWVGHIYDGQNFDNYLGYYNIGSETFSEGFGSAGTWPNNTSDDASCFNVYSDGAVRGSVKTITFSVRYRMISAKRGFYRADMSGDDGNRLYVDESLVYSDWSDHSPRTNSNVLLSLTGNSALTFEYYENLAQNITGFNNLVPIFANSLSANLSQAICLGNSGTSITGDTYGSLPSGISLSGTGYQWVYSTEPEGARTVIAGATGAAFTPNTSLAPFNVAGTYYVFRNAVLQSLNNVSPNPCLVTNESNPATIIVNSSSSATITYPGSPFCKTLSSPQAVILTGTAGGIFTAIPSGLAIDATTGAITPSSSTAGNYTVKYTLSGSAGCGNVIAETSISILTDQSWTGSFNTDWNIAANWSCGTIPDLTTNVLIPNVANQPILSSGGAGSAKDVVIESGSSLNVIGNTLKIAGTITSGGTFGATEGTIEMAGSSAQSIGANVFSTNTVMDLIINNPQGVSLTGPLNITGVVTAQSGNLLSSGNLTLISTASQTALIDGAGMGTISGNVNIQRYVPNGMGYKFISSPFQSATVNELADDLDLAAAFPSFYAYDEDNHSDSAGITRYSTGWVKYLAGTLEPMKGYAANFGLSTDPKTFDITGVVNNNISSTSTLFNHNRLYTNGFNLVGNPYPSPVDWEATNGWTRNNIDDAIYYFDSGSSQYTGTYSTYINGASSDGFATGLIAAMQGFFVHVSDGAYPVTGTLGMTKEVRVNNLNPNFHKISGIRIRPLIRLSARFEDEDSQSDAALIYFDDLATDGFNKDRDALKMLNTDELVPNLYSMTADRKSWLSINGLAYHGDSLKIIPLGINTLKPGWIEIQLSDLENIPVGMYVYLYDSETGMNQDLQYSSKYRTYLPAGEHSNRFSLKLSLTDLTFQTGISNSFLAYCAGNDLRIKLMLDQDDNALLSVCNLTGQVVWRLDVSGIGYGEISKQLATGLYIVSLYRSAGIQSQKVYVPSK